MSKRWCIFGKARVLMWSKGRIPKVWNLKAYILEKLHKKRRKMKKCHFCVNKCHKNDIYKCEKIKYNVSNKKHGGDFLGKI